MARYTGPVGKISRRLGIGITAKGERILARRPTPPGQHGDNGGRPRKRSEYAMQLIEKQKARFLYGVQERYFSNLFEEAVNTTGVTGDILLEHLERRLDNVVYRFGFGLTRRQARQLVNHGHFLVDGKKVTIPSFRVQPGQIIAVSEKSRKSPYFKALRNSDKLRPHQVPDWLSLDGESMTGRVMANPRREHAEPEINAQIIVEFYSR